MWLYFMAAAGIVDLVTTWLALRDGATEQNPIAKLFGNTDRAIMYTAAVSKVIGILLVGLVIPSPWDWIAAIVIGCLWLFGGGVYNIVQMIKFGGNK